MPLNFEDRQRILTYCDRDVPDVVKVDAYFDFITDGNLRQRLVSEYLAARYIYKLGEALYVDGDKLAAHAKFQIVQYASIYEAIIVHILWGRFSENDQVTNIEYYYSLRKAASAPQNILIRTTDDEEVFLCTESKRKNTQHAIKFDKKVEAAVSIGFVDEQIGEEIKEFYRLRNGIHLENAVKNEIEYEIEQSALAYRRIRPFTTGVRDFLNTGRLSNNAKPEPEETDQIGI